MNRVNGLIDILENEIYSSEKLSLNMFSLSVHNTQHQQPI